MSQRVVIIGGGAMGGAIALFLALRPEGFAVTVLERDLTYAQASSALSAGSVRQQFSLAVNVQMSLFGHAFLADPAQWLAVDGQVPELGLVNKGYLFLATAAGERILRENHAVQTRCGAAVELLDTPALAACHPWLNTADIALASYGTANEGWFDGYALTQALRRKNQSLGVNYLRAEVTALHTRGDYLHTAGLADGTQIAADVFVNAAGPWAGKVAAMAGIDLPVSARRRTVFAVSSPAQLPGCPMVIDPSGLWFRPEGAHFICGISPAEDEADPDDLPLEPDLRLFESHIWPRMAHRVPGFEALRMERAWAGYYEVNTLDHNAVIGTHPTLSNLYFANGFSGHGLQHAPAAGLGIAELIATGGYQTLDLSALGFDRVLTGAPLLERNII
ncbi:MAG: NAD(P)/FAD-dependent oxidoreductase [Burkholderiaceae bacterium]